MDPSNETMEQQIMGAIQPVIRELRMVEVADFISYLNFQHHHQVKDIVDSAGEQYFAPGFLGYRDVGAVEVDWETTPTVKLELVMNAPDASFEFELTLENDAATVRLVKTNDHARIDSDRTSEEVLRRAIEVNRV